MLIVDALVCTPMYSSFAALLAANDKCLGSWHHLHFIFLMVGVQALRGAGRTSKWGILWGGGLLDLYTALPAMASRLPSR